MRTHHCEKIPIAIDGFTDVLIPTERKHEYWRMIGVLKFSNPAFGQMYHCNKRTPHSSANSSTQYQGGQTRPRHSQQR